MRSNMMNTPIERYHADLKKVNFTFDVAQEIAVQHTQQLYESLLHSFNKRKGYFQVLRDRLLLNKSQQREPLRGLYLWGGVGRGKTYLMDNFFNCLSYKRKLRLHFHHFMQQVHFELKQLKDVQNPLQIVAQRFSDKAHIIFLDEFHVTDITDAMLLSGLLKALFKYGVTLVITSNSEPDHLYQDGLQREQFLPAIALLKQYTHIVNVDSGIDYRFKQRGKADIYHCPSDEIAQRKLLESFKHLAPTEGIAKQVLTINGRPLPTVRCAEGVVWFDFKTLCDTARSVADYIELAHYFHTLFISYIPQMTTVSSDAALRFIRLVDELYDRNVKLLISAQVPIDDLYVGTKHAFQFQRTISRLEEMCSHDYLERRHLP